MASTVQHRDLIRFITDIPVAEDGTVYDNNLDDVEGFQSQMYEPNYTISVLSLITLDKIDEGVINLVNVPLNEGTITQRIMETNMSDDDRKEYLLLRTVILESFSLLFNIDNAVDNLRYVSESDIKRVRNNINYLTDFMGTKPKYYHLVEQMRDMDISLGYLEHQIDVIMGNRGMLNG